jgi:diphosphomevalonate decarboxylase
MEAKGSDVAIATACANIALVKYWGKREGKLNLPAAGSVSLTLDALRTWTSVSLSPEHRQDVMTIDDQAVSEAVLARTSRFVDLIRDLAGSKTRVSIRSKSNFPTAAGLASSASGFAALAVAVSDAFGLSLDGQALSILARRGSGSAARSIFGGFVRMHAGERADGTDAFATPIPGLSIPMAAVVAPAAKAGPKAIGSTEGMEQTRMTSPYYDAWIAQVDIDIEESLSSLEARDWDRIAQVVEGSCLAMHANAMAARPGIVYFQGSTLLAMNVVRSLRHAGVPVCFTVDAGPHLVAFTEPDYQDRVANALSQVPGVGDVIKSSSGEGAHLVGRMP